MVKIPKEIKRLASIGMLTTMLTTSVVPGFSFAAEKSSNEKLKVAVISDVHMFPKSYIGNEGPNYQEYVNGDRKMLKESERIFEASLNRVIKSDAEIVLIPGDLTKDSEIEAHEIVAKGIERLEKAGKEVFVTNGNHDINAPDAEKFIGVDGNADDIDRTDRVEKLQGIMPDEFETLYANYGFNDENTIANDPNSTSYVAQLKPGYRLIAMDTGIYGQNKDDQSTSGTLDKDGRLDWVLEQVKIAKDAGDTVIGMSHHGIVEHFDGQGTVFAPYLVERYEEISTLLADSGMEYVFTGHFHAQDIAVKTTDSGNTIMDIMTGSSVSYPSPIRFAEIDSNLKKIEVETERIDSIEGIDDFKTYSEEAMRAGVPGMVSSLVSDLLIGFVDGILPSSMSGDVVKVTKSIEEYINNEIEENREVLEEEALKAPQEKSSDSDIDVIPGILKKSQFIKYIEAVCEDLKTVEIETSIGTNYKLMDAIEHCLMEVYGGDEEYSQSMKTLKMELETKTIVQDGLVNILNKNKSELGLVGMIINKDMLDGLFNTEVSEGTTVGGAIGGAFAGLLDGILTDDTPDNNASYIDGKLVVDKPSTGGGAGSGNIGGDNTATEFKDTYNHWAKSAIDKFTQKGYIDGYGDSTFRPDNSITRAEFIKIVNKLYGFEEKSSIEFKDVNSNEWYYEEVSKGMKAGYIDGYGDNTFKPNKDISREEACKIIAEIMNIKGDGKLEYKDSDSISTWSKEYVDALSDAGIVDGYEDNTFKPNNKITRAESVSMMDRIK